MENVDKYYLTAVTKYTGLNAERGVWQCYPEKEFARFACVSSKYLDKKETIEKVYVDFLTGEVYLNGLNEFWRHDFGTEFIDATSKQIPLNLLVKEEKMRKKELKKRVREIVTKLNNMHLEEKSKNPMDIMDEYPKVKKKEI